MAPAARTNTRPGAPEQGANRVARILEFFLSDGTGWGGRRQGQELNRDIKIPERIVRGRSTHLAGTRPVTMTRSAPSGFRALAARARWTHQFRVVRRAVV